MGMAQATSTNTPKIMLPSMAPNRAAANVIDIAVDLQNEINKNVYSWQRTRWLNKITERWSEKVQHQGSLTR